MKRTQALMLVMLGLMVCSVSTGIYVHPSLAPFTSADLSEGSLVVPTEDPPSDPGGVQVELPNGKVIVKQSGSKNDKFDNDTDVAVSSAIKTWSATLGMPDVLQAEIDNWTYKAIDANEFPNGVVVTAVRLKTSASSTYSLDIENWDDPTTQNGANGAICTVATSTSTEASQETITYSTIAAGQIIMLDLPTTDVGWAQIDIDYYEPATP